MNNTGSTSTASERVLVLGTGVMGSALARAFKAGGCDVTVWNRTPGRAEPLKALGIAVADELVDAIDRATLVVGCLWNYKTSSPLLQIREVEARLKGKTFVNYTTCVAEEAREWGRWAQVAGIDYIEGAIMAYPKDVGTPTGLLLNAGDAAAWERHRDALTSLGGRAVFVGTDPAAACILDTALLIYHWGTALSLYSSALMAQAQGIGLDQFMPHLKAFQPIVVDHMQLLQTMAANNDFNGVQAPLDTHLAALEGVHQQATAVGAPTAMTRMLLDVFTQGVGAGRGSEELPVVYDVLRAKAAPRGSHGAL